MNLRIFDTVEELVPAAARAIVQRAAGKKAFSVALSGGSTPKPLYQLLGSSPLRDELAGIAVTWVVVDERYVPMSDPQSNAAMIEKTLFAGGMTPGHRFLRFRTELNDPARTASEFEKEWQAFGLGSLDIVILGVGEDGHTASLFPGTTALGVEDRMATEVFVPGPDMWRVTITKPVIRAAGLRMVLAAGQSKQAIIRQIREGAELPIALATGGEIETWWFVDRAAWE
jgi:6-phosphogluconolactonase